MPLLKKRENMGWMDIASFGMDALNTVGGWFGGQSNAQQQYKRQRNLNKQMQDIQQQNWDYTNAENQVKHYEEAGLNPGLMYGSSGGGGATMGGSSGGSVGMAETPKFMGLGIQGAQVESQIELNKALAEKAKAEAQRTAGQGAMGALDMQEANSRIGKLTAETGNVDQDKKLKEVQTTSQEIDNYIKDSTKELSIENAINLSEKLEQEVTALKMTNYKNSETLQTDIQQVKANLATTYLQQQATKAGIALTQEQTRKISEELAQGWEHLSLKQDSNQIEFLKAKITKVLGEENLKLIERGQNIEIGKAVTNIMGSKGSKTTTRKAKQQKDGSYLDEYTTTTTKPR